jgi:mannitol/fructose-specific phosphotransferase system IIA component (Ntr-type)
MLFAELDESLVAVCLPASSRDEVIDQLLGMLEKTGKVRDPALARQDIVRNEQVMAFGMQHGIAIPHAKTEAVEELLACIAVTETPVDFSGIDGTPSSIFVMTLSPPDQVGPHIRFLSEIGRLLKNRRLRKAILQARTPQELLGVIKGAYR